MGIIEYIQHVGCTKSELCRKANINRSYIHMIINGEREPSLFVAYKIHLASGKKIGISDLISEEMKRRAIMEIDLD